VKTRNGFWVAWAAITAGAAVMPAGADVPKLVGYQGKLVGSSGVTDGSVNLTVTIYDAQVGGSVLFQEDHANVPVVRGLFGIVLGSQTTLPDGVLAGTSVYVGISVNGTAELSPRTQLLAAPYAVKSKSAEQLVKPGTMTPAVTVDGSTGYVGVGTSAPATNLDVAGQIKIGGGSPGAGKVLTSDANGLAQWGSAPASSPWLATTGGIYYDGGNVGSAPVCPPSPCR